MYFSPRFADVAWGAECFDHTVDLNSAGGSAATHTTSESPCSTGCPVVSDDVHTIEGIDVFHDTCGTACPSVLPSALGSRGEGHCPQQSRTLRRKLARTWQPKYVVTAPIATKIKSINDDNDRKESTHRMKCKPAGQTIEVAGDCGNERPELSILGGEPVGNWPAHDVRPSLLLREQLFADCPRAACRHAKSPNCPRELAPVPALMSESIGELLQNGPVAKETERSSYRLDQRVATNNERHRCEDAETFHGRRFSSWEESNSVPTLGGERSSCSNEKLAGHRNLIELSRLAQLDELAGAVKHLTRSRDNNVPE